MTPAGTGIPTQIGPYKIEREIARGGMGIVYLARDTRLDRPAAIKALPDDVAHDPERLARFEREAKTLASLNHPNIAGIYGLEENGGRRYLALEHIEGETLAARIARGPLPLAETLEICVQIAAGVEAAHESGVIHRDLKPGNVMITPGDHVKVLDFGLAKGKVAEESGVQQAAPPLDSPTLSSPTLPHSPTSNSPATLPGVILGTAAYLSPEQARGKAVDRRTDIWSFGCVLYECLTAERAFEGETVSDTIAKILVQDVEWSRLPKSTPPRVRELLQRCLEKDPRKRLRDIGEARLALEGVRSGATAGGAHLGPQATPVPATPVGRAREAMRSHGYLFAAGLILGALLGLNMLGRPARDAGGPVLRLSIPIPPDLKALAADLSPDGTMEAMIAEPRLPAGAPPRIYIRPLNKAAFEPIRGTEGARAFGFSPDSRWIAYAAPISERSAQVRVFRVPVDGSAPPVPLFDWRDEWEGAPMRLSSGETIVASGGGRSFVRIPRDGGAPSTPIKFDMPDSSAYFSFARILPGERTAFVKASSYERGAYQEGIGIVDLESGKTRVLVRDGGGAHYAATGHILFTRHDVLYAAPFDLKKLTVAGEAVPVMDGLRTGAEWMNASFDLSENGILQITPGGAGWVGRHAVVVAPGGTVSEWSGERQAFEGLEASPDGKRFAAQISNTKPLYEIWVSERGRRGSRRAISAPNADCWWPCWSPDGSRIAYIQSAQADADGIYVASVAGGEAPRLVFRTGPTYGMAPVSWSPDGSRLLAEVFDVGKRQLVSIPAVSAGAAPTPRPPSLFGGGAEHTAGQFAPDGRSIAFESDETGKPEVYVCGWGSDKPTGEPVQVSEKGGQHPMWSRDGRRLYYRTPQNKVMSISITTNPEITASAPLLVWDLDALGIVVPLFDILPDGSLVGIHKGEGEDEITRFDLTINFYEELKRRFAVTAPRKSR